MNEKKYYQIIQHLEEQLQEHGDTHLGMGWPYLADMHKRYRVMFNVIKKFNVKTTLLDFGCGTASTNDYIIEKKYSNIEYFGLDISEKFLEVCRNKYPNNIFYHCDILDTNLKLPTKENMQFEEMYEYFKSVIRILYKKSNYGIAFNVMAKAVDWERDDLFHMPTDLLIDFLTKEISRHFVIRNDYGLYESLFMFTNNLT